MDHLWLLIGSVVEAIEVHPWLLLASVALIALTWHIITSAIEVVCQTPKEARTIICCPVLGLTATLALCTAKGTYHLGRWGYNKLRL